ncbi:MAG: ABC transporter permease [Nitrospira sp.]|nr:ABC transporter permease [Nitrospira sp.]MBS0178216.1 ABC transporter permease [Nitrospira sp.]
MISQQYGISPLMVFTSISVHWDLIRQLTRREIASRYRGSLLGILWAFLHPMVMLTVYTLVFQGAFGMRWGQEGESALDFGLLLFSGLIVHALFAESIHRAPYLIVNHSNYVKKIVFPLEILAWTYLGSALFHAAVSALVLIVVYGLLHHGLHWTMLLLPLLLLPLSLVTLGMSWFLASAGVFVRDIGQASGPLTTVMLFLSPVFYPAAAFPESYRVLLYANPLTFLITQAQDLLIWGKAPSWVGIALYWAGSYLVAWCGLLWFLKTRKAFADVL